MTGLPTSAASSSQPLTAGSSITGEKNATGSRTSATSSFNTITTGPTMTSGTGANGSSASPSPTSSYFCYPFQDPDKGPVTPRCECDGLQGFYPYLSSTTGETNYNPCGYTASPTEASTTSVPGFTTTQSDGAVVSCASSTYENFAVNENPTCAGSTKTVSTVASVASVYSASTASAISVASIASASAAAESAAAAVPSAACWILGDDGFGDSSFEVYGINGWAGDGGSNLWKQENGCGILSGQQFSTDGQSEFDGQFRNTQTAYFGLSFFKGGCVERAVHSAGGPPPGKGPGQIQCLHVPKLSSDQLDAKNSISGAQLKAVQAVANATPTTGNDLSMKEYDVVQPDEASAVGTGAAQATAALVASASAALPHLLSAASSASLASPSASTS